MSIASQTKKETSEEARALVRAAGEGDAERIRSLLGAGADVNAAADAGETALMRASAGGRLEVVKLLLDAGGDVHARSENGFTPLFMAVFFGHAEVARLLLARGSDPSAPTRVNTTALEWARTRASAEVVELLEEFEAIRARGREPEHELSDDARPGAPPVFFPTDGEVRPVVPLSKIADAPGADVATPATSGDAPMPESVEDAVAARVEDVRAAGGEDDVRDETTLVPARVRFETRDTVAAVARRKGIRVSWGVTTAAVALSIVVGAITGAFLIGSGDSGATEQAASRRAESNLPATKDSPGVTAAPADVNVESKAGEEKESDEVGADARKVNSDEAATKEVNSDEVATKASRASASDLSARAAESPSHHAAVADARPERQDHTTDKAVERHDADVTSKHDPASKHDAVAKRRERASVKPTPAPAAPKLNLPVSSPPPSAKSKQVIPWP